MNRAAATLAEPDADAPETMSVTAPAAAARRHVAHLTLTNFRSYAHVEAAFDGRPVTLSGENGAGKTNLLEAISIFSPGRGLRGARLADIARQAGAGDWAVSMRLAGGGETRRLGAGIAAARPDRRECRIDQAPAAGSGAFQDHLRQIWLTPAQDRLFLEGPKERRRFLDRMTLAHVPSHAANAAAFETAMRQRQRLLDERNFDDAWLTGLERRMAEAGVAVAAARCEMVARLKAADLAVDEAAFPAGDIAIDGFLEEAAPGGDVGAVEDLYAETLARCRRRDAEAGRALTGPHRSDLLVAHRAKAQPAKLCSTGEQKALLIRLVLSAAAAVRRELLSGNLLVLLLDDIVAHLDPVRRAGLFSILDELDCHSFMSGTDLSLFEAWGDRAQHMVVADHRVTSTNSPG